MRVLDTIIMPHINKPKKKRIRTYKTDINFAKFYNDIRWKNLRNWYITEHCLCEECLKNNIATPATEVHHIVPWSRGENAYEMYNLLLDPNNLMSLCKHCHKEKHKANLFKRIKK